MSNVPKSVEKTAAVSSEELSKSVWTNFINIHYGACLSMIIAVTIVSPPPSAHSSALSFMLNVSDDGRLSFFAMVLYFFIDWLAINVRRPIVKLTIKTLFANLVWAWFLGYCVIISKNSSSQEFYLIGLYSLVAGLYHGYRYLNRQRGTPDSHSLLQSRAVILCAYVVLIALVLLLVGVLHAAIGTEDPNIQKLVNLLVVVICIGKVAELFLFSQLHFSSSSVIQGSH
jgi:hypothetical protein